MNAVTKLPVARPRPGRVKYTCYLGAQVGRLVAYRVIPHGPDFPPQMIVNGLGRYVALDVTQDMEDIEQCTAVWLDNVLPGPAIGPRVNFEDMPEQVRRIVKERIAERRGA